MKHCLKRNGFAVIRHALDASQRLELIDALGPVTGAGRRGLMGLPIVAKLASSGLLLDLVRPHLKFEPRPVRGIYFDKSRESNWLVAWHQDLTLAVRGRVNVPGFGPWGTKDGVPHVQPPIELLQQMLTVRLHLDDCDETNGALRVIPWSHAFGRLTAEGIRQLSEHSDAVDNCDPSPVVKIIKVISNEPDIPFAPDWEITGAKSLNLRAERLGKGQGRIYTIVVQCKDMSGNVSTASVDVAVPHN